MVFDKVKKTGKINNKTKNIAKRFPSVKYKIGPFSKSEILEILGQPSTRSTFSDNIWYYIYFIQRERAYFQVKNTGNKVLKIKFDEKQNVESYDIIKNNTSIKIKTVKITTKNNTYSKTLVREFLDSFVRRIEEPE